MALWVLFVVHRWVERVARYFRRLVRRFSEDTRAPSEPAAVKPAAPDGGFTFREVTDRLAAHGVHLRRAARRGLAGFKVAGASRDLEVRFQRDAAGNTMVVPDDVLYLGGICEELVGGRCSVCVASREAEEALRPAAASGGTRLVSWVVLIISSVMLLAVGALLWSGCGRPTSARAPETPLPDRVSVDFTTGPTAPGAPFAEVSVVLERPPGAGLEGRATVTTAACFTEGGRRVEKVALTAKAWSAFVSAVTAAAERGGTPVDEADHACEGPDGSVAGGKARPGEVVIAFEGPGGRTTLRRLPSGAWCREGPSGGHDALDPAAADAALAPFVRHLGIEWIGGFLRPASAAPSVGRRP